MLRSSPFRLPDRNADRTSRLKTAWELTPYYSRAYSKGCLYVRGRKPKGLAQISKISARRWEQYENHCKRENPILKGLRFLRVFEQDSVQTYAQAADVLGISRQRLYQLIWLVTKLPQDVKDYLVANEDPIVFRYFTERRLRPLTKLASDAEKCGQFRTMLASAQQEVSQSATS